MLYFFMYVIIINVLGIIVMFVDKRKAINNQWRIPERTLWMLAGVGGAIGVWIGMKRFRHKTKHTSFRVGVPIVIMIQFGLLLFYLQKLS
jgi:uncharacterized membrane protein YsdA (DUF1294 family)